MAEVEDKKWQQTVARLWVMEHKLLYMLARNYTPKVLLHTNTPTCTHPQVRRHAPQYKAQGVCIRNHQPNQQTTRASATLIGTRHTHCGWPSRLEAELPGRFVVRVCVMCVMCDVCVCARLRVCVCVHHAALLFSTWSFPNAVFHPALTYNVQPVRFIIYIQVYLALEEPNLLARAVSVVTLTEHSEQIALLRHVMSQRHNHLARARRSITTLLVESPFTWPSSRDAFCQQVGQNYIIRTVSTKPTLNTTARSVSRCHFICYFALYCLSLYTHCIVFHSFSVSSFICCSVLYCLSLYTHYIVLQQPSCLTANLLLRVFGPLCSDHHRCVP